MSWSRAAGFILVPLILIAAVPPPQATAQGSRSAPTGARPTDGAGRLLNFDFESGDLRDWTAEGEAFQGQPVQGDTVYPRRHDMHSRHAGRFWVGSFERKGDKPRGTLTSVTFPLTKPFARFLVAGGARDTTHIEIVRADTGAVIYRTSGDDTEELKPVVADLSAHQGKRVFIRLVDSDSEGWGHLNFDDFTLWDAPPPTPIRPGAPPPDAFAYEGLSPGDAAAAMTVPAGFRVTLFAGEPDVVQPIAFAIDDRGRLWVAEAYSYPVRVTKDKARDRILIFEDTDDDGRFDTRTVFAEGLNLVSGIELGFGGVWVGAAPDLLFIPDRDGDDRPDGPPEILLDGWGYQDTHETLNSFTWGPDGWLYGCHGVFTHSRVGKPGTPDAERVSLNAGIWRYHPTRRVFEVFAQGTSNPWGVDFDEHGQAFLTSCVIPHLYHVIQGARYERQAGSHFNPFTYEDIKTIADHRHYVGANPHAGNGRSESAGGGHAHAGAMIYLGGTWPAEYRGSIFMNNIHGARLNRDVLTPSGSGFVGRHAPDFLLANDRWSQVVSLKSGPDGNVYMIDWYDKNQCHRRETEVHDRSNGRIFKISHVGETGRFTRSVTDARRVLSARTPDPAALATLLLDKNEWTVRHGLRRLQEVFPKLGDAGQSRLLERIDQMASGSEGVRLRALWATHAIGRLDEPRLVKVLNDPNPYLRACAVELASENGSPPSSPLALFSRLAKSDPSPVVRLYLASALQRLPRDARWAILEGLASHREDAGDPNIPLMVWYAAEPLAEADPSRALGLALESKLPNLLPFMVRRVSALGTPQAVSLLVKAIGNAKSDPVRLTIVEGLNEALKGRRAVPMPEGWSSLYPALQASENVLLRSRATALALTFGDPSALDALRKVLKDRNSPPGQRTEALAALLKSRDPDLPATLTGLLNDQAVRSPVVRALAAFDSPKAAGAILSAYATMSPDERRDALNTLAARVGSARTLLNAVGQGSLAARDVSADVIRQLRNLKNPDIDVRIAKVWGSVRETTAYRAKAIAKYRAMLSEKPDRQPDAELGRAVFAKTCQQCHTLFGVGSTVGPELTGSNRADLEYVLSNVLDPSALIGKDYVAQVVATKDGRVLTGLVRDEDKDALTIQTANEVVVIPLSEVEERKPSEQSMMPEDLWTPLSEHEIRSLVAYLASPSQAPMLATLQNVSGFFNGRDLTGWVGDPALWSVQKGEIVGRTAGLTKNAFLRSEMSAADFRLTLKVKLVGEAGNSGIQFRSQALPGDEMKGDQADVGPGWWGKLYEENGRGLLWPRSGESFVHRGEWNDYEILAEGSRVRTKINGAICVDLDDPEGFPRGVFGLQLHSGGPTEVRFKDVRLELISKDGLKPVTSGGRR